MWTICLKPQVVVGGRGGGKQKLSPGMKMKLIRTMRKRQSWINITPFYYSLHGTKLNPASPLIMEMVVDKNHCADFQDERFPSPQIT